MKGKKTTGTVSTKMRVPLGLVLIMGVVLGLSFWRSERVDAQDKVSGGAYVPQQPAVKQRAGLLIQPTTEIG